MQLLFCANSFSQQTFISVSGKVFDAENNSLSFPVLMIVNLSTQRGIFGNTDGTFTTLLDKKDSLLISATGYTMKKICFKDSADQSTFYITVPLSKLHKDLKEVEIFPERDLDKIEKDIQKLGYDESDYRLTGIDAWRAPLSALYEEFSAKEKDKRKAAELRNESRRHDLLKELLRLYEKNKLVNLPAEEFDAFIDYLNINDEMMKRWTQYELAIYIKSKYEHFRN
ncbi:MAG TPA: hypothetical protein VJY62_17135 [Bacteroidia bacterium]|nr:hypothetical protein [Bacteroidia bacterium]